MVPLLLLFNATLLFVARPRFPALRRWLATPATRERLGYTALYLFYSFLGIRVYLILAPLAVLLVDAAWFALTGDCPSHYQSMHPDCVHRLWQRQAATPPVLLTPPMPSTLHMPSTVMHASPTTRYRAPLMPYASVYGTGALHKDEDEGLIRQRLGAQNGTSGGALADLD
ncbi:uncharacterized protein SCHCODRAFT_02545035 [Schizophyllum commune H4-8]|nr:uncharacterized protein SCHCODRAFT_02545035 [Schizophyllum commune H4-8]KAI5891575.1 hypothetical protein SCHCODRAFT_02545035 [Schizophyllum commune H4-8]